MANGCICEVPGCAGPCVTRMRNLQNVVDEVVRTGSKGFVTCVSGAGYKVLAKFRNLEDTQRYYTALSKLRVQSSL